MKYAQSNIVLLALAILSCLTLTAQSTNSVLVEARVLNDQGTPIQDALSSDYDSKE